MIKCSEEKYACSPICDHCLHYDFNGDEKGRYTGNGFCRKHNKKSEPTAGANCDDYHCFTVKDSNNEQNNTQQTP